MSWKELPNDVLIVDASDLLAGTMWFNMHVT
jgi:hypothetical protein